MPTQPHTRSGAARGWPGLLILLSAVLLLTAACGQVIVVTPDPAAQPTADPAAESVAEDIVGVTVDTAEASAGIISQFINRLLVAPQNELMRVLLVVAGVKAPAAMPPQASSGQQGCTVHPPSVSTRL